MGVWECGNTIFLCGEIILLNTNKYLEKPKVSMGVWGYGSVENIFYVLYILLTVL
jgi:hypothetical protein